MALASGANIIQYALFIPTDKFDFPYKYWESEQLVVSFVDNNTGIETILDLNAGDYTVSPTNGDPAQGATITTAVPYNDGRITIERIVVVESEADFVRGDGIPPDALNSEFDKSAARQQQFEAAVLRSVQHPASDPDGLNYETPTVELRVNKALGYDSNGNIVAISLASTGTLGADTAKGVIIVSNVISTKVDGSYVVFDGGGNISIAPISLDSAVIADDAIITSKILNGAVTFAKLQDLVGNSGDGGFVLGNMVGPLQPPYPVQVQGDLTAPDHFSLLTSQAIADYIPQYVGASIVGVTQLPGNVNSDLDLSSLLPVDTNRYMVHFAITNIDVAGTTVGVVDGNFTNVNLNVLLSNGRTETFDAITSTSHLVRWRSGDAYDCVVSVESYQRVN